MEHTEDTQDCPDPTRRLDFAALSASARSHSSDTVSMSSLDDTAIDALPPVGESGALHLDSLGLCEMHRPLVHSPMFRLDSDPEPDTPAPRTPPLNALGLEAMPTPRCDDSATLSVNFGMPHRVFLQLSSPGSALSCSTDVSDGLRRRRNRIKRRPGRQHGAGVPRAVPTPPPPPHDYTAHGPMTAQQVKLKKRLGLVQSPTP